MSVLIVGCGYVGRAFAALAAGNGQPIWATCRSQDKSDGLSEMGLTPLVMNWLDPGDWPRLPQVDNVLISISHSPVEGVHHRETHAKGLCNLFARLGKIRRVVYLSTTGVYTTSAESTSGDHDWVDEDSLVDPKRPGSIAALAAEQWLEKRFHSHNNRLSILRLAGIYGPNRTPNLDRLRSGLPLEIDPNSYLNLIHVDDIAAIIQAIFARTEVRRRYLVSDGNPVLRGDYYRFLSSQIGLPEPTFRPIRDQVANSPRGAGSKRISNRRLVEDLEYRFLYPSYQQGFASLLAK